MRRRDDPTSGAWSDRAAALDTVWPAMRVSPENRSGPMPRQTEPRWARRGAADATEDQGLRMDTGHTGRSRHALRRARRGAGGLAATNGPQEAMPGGLRPGAARKLHRKRDRGRPRVRPDEAEAAAAVRAVAALHLLQRAGDRGHGRRRLRGADSRRGEERRHAGRLQGDHLAVRDRQVPRPAVEEELRRRGAAPGDSLPAPDSDAQPAEGLPRRGLSLRLRLRRLRELRKPGGGEVRPRTASACAGAAARRPRRARRWLRRGEPVVHRPQLLGAEVGDARVLHAPVSLPPAGNALARLLDDPLGRVITPTAPATPPAAAVPPPAAAPPASEDPDVAIAFALGWQVAGLYRDPHHERPDTRPLPEYLPGIGSLTQSQRTHLGIRQIEAGLHRLSARIDVAGLGAPAVAPVREAFSGAADPATGEPLDLRRCVLSLHRETLETLSAADFRLGKAYGLGRAMAETCEVGDATSLASRFDHWRIRQLDIWLADLDTALPAHASSSVRKSLARWAEWAADPHLDGDPFDWQRDLEPFRQFLYRQTELWRGLLSGAQ